MTEKKRWPAVTNKLLALGIGGVVALFLAEGTLALLGCPTETGYTNPAGYEKDFVHIEFTYNFRANSMGLRSPEIPVHRPDGSRRILVVGDSYTEGVGVEYEETFSAILDREFHPDEEIDIINGGIQGRGPLHYGRVFMTAGLQYDPSTLLIALHTNDLADMNPDALPQDIYSERRSGLKKLCHALWPRMFIQARTAVSRAEIREEGFLEFIQRNARDRNVTDEEVDRWVAKVPPDLLAAAERDEFSRPGLALGLFRPNYLTTSLDIDNPSAERRYDAMIRVVEEIIAECRRRNIAVGLVYTPAPPHFDKEWFDPRVQPGVVLREAWLAEKTELQERLTAFSRRLAVPFLDLTPAFRERSRTGTRLNFARDGHWNPAGHRVAAEEIGAWMDQENLCTGN